jgi:signal transduction histidine kinase
MDPSDTAGRIDRLLACLRTALGHELPNRFVATQGLLQILSLAASQHFDAEHQEYLRRVTALVRRSQVLVSELNQLVRVSHLQADGETTLGEIVPEAVAELKQLCPGAVVHPRLADAGPIVKLSPLVLRQILVQLMKALVTRAGSGVAVTVELGAVRDDNGVRVWLRDDGPGWASDQLPKVFEPFTGAETDSGLGLYPVRHLVESWGGTVAVTSSPGAGTTFTLTWKD